MVSQSEGCSGQDRLISNHESIQLQIHRDTQTLRLYNAAANTEDTSTFTVDESKGQSSGLKKNDKQQNNNKRRTNNKKNKTRYLKKRVRTWDNNCITL